MLFISRVSFVLAVFPLQSSRLQTFNCPPFPELLPDQAVTESVPQCWLNLALYLQMRAFFFLLHEMGFHPLKTQG